MSESISWSVVARVDAGPVVSAEATMQADAYDKLEVTIAAHKTLAVSIAPDKWTSVQLLVLSPETPNKLTYAVDSVDIAFDNPHFLVGGAVALLGTGSASLSFKNDGDTDTTVDILVGRKAT